ncbi:MAG: HD-GYP domain-containing protein [Ktedonobacteraceae bacterium]|nr:HD-GYP domain-containing protein [Ktedonobacteraceae bacterium]
MIAQNVPMFHSLSLSEMSMVGSLQAICDQDTSAHGQRVMLLAEGVARELQIAEDEIFLVCLAALLHDIGKANIPEAILNKRGPLDELELRVIRRHPEFGQMMLLQVGGIFERLAPAVLTHHERWDGKGYPNKVSGEEIPLAARIIAVTDAYDAMVQRRAYHKPLTHTEACVELQRCAGSQFDPHIVALFLSLLELQGYSKHIRAVGEVEWAGVKCVKPSLQSDEFVHVLV